MILRLRLIHFVQSAFKHFTIWKLFQWSLNCIVVFTVLFIKARLVRYVILGRNLMKWLIEILVCFIREIVRILYFAWWISFAPYIESFDFFFRWFPFSHVFCNFCSWVSKEWILNIWIRILSWLTLILLQLTICYISIHSSSLHFRSDKFIHLIFYLCLIFEVRYNYLWLY